MKEPGNRVMSVSVSSWMPTTMSQHLSSLVFGAVERNSHFSWKQRPVSFRSTFLTAVGAGRKQISHLNTRAVSGQCSTCGGSVFSWGLASPQLLDDLCLSCLPPSPSPCLVTKQPVRVNERTLCSACQSCGLEPWLLSRG